jgi:hypothetical protein
MMILLAEMKKNEESGEGEKKKKLVIKKAT